MLLYDAVMLLAQAKSSSLILAFQAT